MVAKKEHFLGLDETGGLLLKDAGGTRILPLTQMVKRI